jgi:hypothetical protein
MQIRRLFNVFVVLKSHVREAELVLDVTKIEWRLVIGLRPGHALYGS